MNNSSDTTACPSGEEAVSCLRLSLDSEERAVSLASQLEIVGLGMNLFTLQTGQASRIHRHSEQEEIYLVLRGQLTLEIEGADFLIEPNQIVRVAPTVRRRVANRHAEACVFLAIGVVGEHRRGDAEAFLSWDDDLPRSPRDVPSS
jgi:mannose-6-phosphate isomerase-like protein (cupin superfamily)